MLLNKILKIMFIVSLIFLVVTLSFKLYLFNFNIYKKEFSENNIYEKIPDADKNALNLIKFMNDEEPLNRFYNEKEKLHLQDIKNLYKDLNLVFYLSSILTIFFLIYFIYNKNFEMISSSFLISSLALMIPLLLFFIIDFNYLFEKFHLIAFNNNLWQLNPNEDNLINLFPEKIQYNIVKKIFITLLIFALILIILRLSLKFVLNFHKQKIFK